MWLSWWIACARPSFEVLDSGAPEHLPNVLLIVLDDVGTEKIRAYGEHDHAPPTPTIDALAESGTRFTTAWAYPLCSPSRAALLTGRYARRAGIGQNVFVTLGHALASEETILPEMLASAPVAYSSGGVGKWHLNPETDSNVDVLHDQGFDRFAGPLNNLHETDSYTDYTWFFDDGRVQRHESMYLTTREVDEALDQVRTLPEPWFVMLALHAPHFPWMSPPGEPHAVETGAVSLEAARYAQTLTAADAEIGRLLAEVDLGTTLVFLLGDNGSPDDVAIEPTPGDRTKGSLYEGGVRIPFLMAGPGVPAGETRSQLVHVVDVFPTIADAVGLVPERPGVPIDGRSLWPVLANGPGAGHPFLFTEYYVHEKPEASEVAVRDERYKFAQTPDGARFHDLDGLVAEGPNLPLGDLTSEQARALAELKDHLKSLNADLRYPESGGCGR